MESDIQNLDGVDSLEIEMADDGIKLHLTRHDKSAVVVDLTSEEYEALEHCFMLTENKKEDCEYKQCKKPQTIGTKYCYDHREPRLRS